MTTRSGMIYKHLIGKKACTIKTQQPNEEPAAAPSPIVFAEFVQLAYGAINEVLQLYRSNPNEQNLQLIQEAVSLTVQLHTHCLNSGVSY
jgi:hypothetical protein